MPRGPVRRTQVCRYEEEIKRLKAELEAGSPGRSALGSAPTALAFHPLPQLEQEMATIGASFIATALAGPPDLAAGGHPPRRPGENEALRASASSSNAASRVTSGKASAGSLEAEQAPAADAASSYASGQKDRSGVYDWLVVYNPNLHRKVAVGLLHSLVHEGVVCSVRFSPNGSILATGSNRAVSLFDVKTGHRIAVLQDDRPDGPAEGDQFFRSVAFSPDGRLLACGSEDTAIRVWDLSTQRLLFHMHGHEQDIYSVEFYGNGNFLASGSGDKTIKLWDLASQKCLHTLHAGSPDSTKDSGITSISISPSGRFLAAGSLDRLIRIWDLASGTPVDVIEGHGDSIYSISFMSDGLHLISGSLDKTVRLWEFESPDNLKGARCRADMVGHKDFVLSVAGFPDSRWFLTGSKDRSVQCWDALTGKAHFMLQGHKNSVIGLAVAPSGTVFATASGDSRARIWSFDSTEVVQDAPGAKEEAPEATTDDEACSPGPKSRRLGGPASDAGSDSGET